MIKWTVRILLVLILPFFIVYAWLSAIIEAMFPKEWRQDLAIAWRDAEETPPGVFLKEWGARRRAALGEKE